MKKEFYKILHQEILKGYPVIYSIFCTYYLLGNYLVRDKSVLGGEFFLKNA